MYSWIWNKLPGPTLVKLLIALVIFAVVVAILFQWVFPWVDSLVPLQDVTIDQSGSDSSGGSR